VDGKLKKFAQTVLTGQGRGGIPRNMMPPGVADAGNIELGDEEETFLVQWGLTDPTAKETLRRLQPAVRQRVMQEFLPGEGTHNLVGKFCGFASSVARAAAGMAEPPRKGGKGGGLSAMAGIGAMGAPSRAAAEALAGLTKGGGTFGLRDVMAQQGFGGKGFGGNIGVHAQGGTIGVTEFVHKWGLDEGSRAMLSGLSPEVQATIMAEFVPRGDTRDLSGKFCAFARSVVVNGSGSRSRR